MMEHEHMVVLVIGGSRSGKSRYAEQLARSRRGKRCFVATAEPFDDEMVKRIERHKADRADAFDLTIEEPIDLASALCKIPPDTAVTIVDCMTVWMGNLLYHQGISLERYRQTTEFLRALETCPGLVVLVTNETGQGIIPADPETRAFRDHAGWLNQDLAAIADSVVWMVAGIPVAIKGVLP